MDSLIYIHHHGQFFFSFGYNVSYKIIDRGIIEIFGPHGISNAISIKSNYLVKLQSSYIYHYTLIILIGSTFVLGIRQFWLLFGEFSDVRVFFIFFVLGLFLVKK